MKNELVTTEKSEIIQSVEMETISEYLDSTGLTKQLLPKEKAMFINMARNYGLNPFKREIYCTVYGEGQYRQCSIVTGYEVYLKRAERIGKLDGWNCDVTGSIKDGTLAATVTIHRKDWTHEFKHTAYYVECVQLNGKTGQPNKIWAKMPIFMTKKVAIAQAFRLCFSDEFGGMPYTSDEMGVEEPKERNITPTENIPAEPAQEVIEGELIANNDRQKLKEIIEKYEKEMNVANQSGNPYDMACEALAENDPVKISNMLSRSIAYLGRKGIQVA